MIEYEKFKALAYSIIDEFLNDIKEKGGTLSNIGSTKEGQEAIRILDLYNLISYRSASKSSWIDITSNGLYVLEYGGIEKYINYLNKNQAIKDKIKDEKESIDFRNAKRIYKYFWVPIFLSILALIVSIGKIIYDYLNLKN
ncbi:hypothetical protein [Daejeonella sp.]|uniref:hypothetical protein n=1 Tax=Daejeonella sp. TaxID=2805397 RepID=UPI00272FDFAC|nr:hypothetical protein [Daejeonella sp.]MDP2412910.1 hypothetical protein [Daejeonella sp.]